MGGAHRTPLASSWLATVWPLGREALWANLLEVYSISRDSQGTYWIGDAEPAFDPDAHAGPMMCLFLIVAVGVRHPSASQLAQDALIAAIDDGRVDGAGLGEAMRIVLTSGTVTINRWVRTLGEVARVSPLHRHVLGRALARALGAQGEPSLPLLELLNEWCAEDGAPVDDEPLRAWLGRPHSGKTGRLARALRARPETPGRHNNGAALRALSGRIERAEGWART